MSDFSDVDANKSICSWRLLPKMQPMYCAPTPRDRNSYVNDLIQWNKTNAMISSVGIVVSLFLIFYSIHVDDGVVFLFSMCNVIIQSVIVCSPVFTLPDDFVVAPPFHPYASPPCAPLKPRQVVHVELFPMKYSSQQPRNDIVIL